MRWSRRKQQRGAEQQSLFYCHCISLLRGDWASARWNQREHAQRAARAILDLERRRKDHGARGRKLVEVAQALQAVAAAAMKEMMRRVRRIEGTRPTRVPFGRLGGQGEDAPFLHKPPHYRSIRPPRMRAVIPYG